MYLERLLEDQVVARRVAGVFAIYLLHLPSVKEPVSNCLCNALFIERKEKLRLEWQAKYRRDEIKSLRLERYHQVYIRLLQYLIVDSGGSWRVPSQRV